MSRSKYHHLKSEDRLKLYSLLLEGLALQAIADELGFHKSTIYRELARNSTKLGYRPDIASQQYVLRRRYHVSKVDKQDELKTYVIQKLEEGWSPEQISGRLAKENGYTVISHEAIYQYIYSPSGKTLKLYKHLRKKRSYRYPRIKRKRQKSNPDKVSIHERDEQVNKRQLFGHWEGDLILFKKTRTNMFTLRERKTRFLVGIKNANRQAKGTSKSLINYMQQKVHTIDTLTLDNDPAFAGYKDLAETLNADIYFCDPYKSWQKGAIENGNRLLREKLPKGFEINSIGQKRIDEIVDNLNNRPMKVLEFMTPKEAFLKEALKRGSL